MTLDWPTLLPLIFAGLMGLAILIYVVLDGFDLGIGILFAVAEPDEQDRRPARKGDRGQRMPPVLPMHARPVPVQRIRRQRVSRHHQPPLHLILDHPDPSGQQRLRLEHGVAVSPDPRPPSPRRPHLARLRGF